MEKKQTLDRLNVMIPSELKRRATEIAEGKGLKIKKTSTKLGCSWMSWLICCLYNYYTIRCRTCEGRDILLVK